MPYQQYKSHLYMLQSPPCQCLNRTRVSQAFLNTLTEIKIEYQCEVNRLNSLLEQRDMEIMELREMVKRKENEIESLLNKLDESRHYTEEMSTTNNKELKNIKDQFAQMEENYLNEVHILNQKYLQKQAELNAVKKTLNSDNFSTSFSTISKKSNQQNKTYSFDLGQYFLDFPQRTLKLLTSLPDEKVEDEKEVGDMICMFISRDAMSAEKYVEVNRNFLKRKIKAEQKRFRIVIIYKPSKKE